MIGKLAYTVLAHRVIQELSSSSQSRSPVAIEDLATRLVIAAEDLSTRIERDPRQLIALSLAEAISGTSGVSPMHIDAISEAISPLFEQRSALYDKWIDLELHTQSESTT